jgi:hypothetical protein
MNATAIPPVIKPRRRLRWLAWLGLCLLACCVAAVLFVVNLFILSRDARAMRNAVTAAAPAGLQTRLELSVGGVVLGLARGGMRLVPDVPTEARSAMKSMRGAEVGLYRLNSPGGKNPAALFQAADEAMAKRGWEMVVRAVHGQEAVAVYVPVALKPGRPLRALVLVLKEQDCVIASVRADLEPLLKLAEQAIADGLREHPLPLQLSAAVR